MILKTYCILLLIITILNIKVESKQIRGVKQELQPLYQDGSRFTCFDNSNTFPADHVNDDYCDCKDGSDEPGTSACENGSFTCSNEGDIPKLIKSSFVNDGICDCCDGSDEYESDTSCSNNCVEIGAERKKAESADKLQWQAGHLIYQQYKLAASEKLTAAKAELELLKTQQIELENEKSKLSEIKIRIEEPEKFAKDEHKKTWDDHIENKRKAEELIASKLLFIRLDLNQDGTLTLEEMRSRKELDIDASGDVTIDEAKVYMVEADAMIFQEFHEKMYSSIKTVIQEDHVEAPASDSEDDTQTTPPPTVEPETTPHGEDSQIQPPLDQGGDQTTAEPVSEEKPRKILKHRYTERGEETYEEDEDLDDTLDSSNDDDVQDQYEDENRETESNDTDDKPEYVDAETMPAYSVATQALIDEAEKARNNFNDIEEKMSNARQTISDLEKKIKEDYGNDNAYYELRDTCFNLIDREYKYTLCPYYKAEQEPANGGSSTSLGTWGKWNGPEDDLYSSMLFSNGIKCWNGPERSTIVKLTCASENKIIKVSEPNKCEYEFTVTSPAACGHFTAGSSGQRDEL